jgi:two-component system, cell cycle sensor histidine kinase and response regulator CckA
MAANKTPLIPFLPETLIEISGVIFVAFDTQGIVTHINKNGCQVLGCSQNEIMGKNWFDNYISMSLRETAKSDFFRIIESKDDVFDPVENSVITKSGQEKIISWHVTILKDENDKTTGALYSGSKVKNRKQQRTVNSRPDGIYRSFFENDISGVYLSSPSGKLLDCNPAFVNIFGYESKNEMLALDMAKLYPQNGNREQFLLQLSRDKKLIGSKIDRVRKDGKIVHCIENMIGNFNDNGMLTQIQGYITDVTDQIQAERALQLKDKQFKDFFENATSGMYRTTPNGEILMANRAIVEMLGFANFEELAQRNLNEDGFIPEFSRSHFQQLVEREGKVIGLETAWTKKDGLRKYVRESATTFHDINGQTLYYEGTIEDITERKRAEMALEESQRQLSILMGNLPGMAYSCLNDQNWTMEFVSQGCTALTGYQAKDVIENSRISYADIIHKDDRGMIWDEIQKAIKKKERFQLIYRITTLEGSEKWVLEQGQGVFDKNTNLIKLEGFIFDITERKFAESALHESERRLRSVLETVDLVAISLDTEGRITFCNDFFLRLTGWTREEIIGKSWFYTCLPGDIREHIEHHVFIKTIQENGFLSHYQNHILTKSKSKRLIAWNNAVFFDAAKNVQGVTSIGEDITERVQAEEALRQSKDQMSKIMLAANDGMWDWDLQTNVVFYDPRYYQMAGYTVNEFPHHFDEFKKRVHPDDLKIVTKNLEDYLSGNSTKYISEFRHKNKKGKWQWIQGRGTVAERDENGKPIKLLGTHTDISKRKRAETALRESETKYRSLIEQSQNAIYLLYENKFEIINPRFTELFGYTQKETQADAFDFRNLLTDASLAIVENRLQRQKNGEKLKPTYEFIAVAKDGRKIDCEVSTSYIDYQGGQATQGIIRDITERKRAEEALRESESKYSTLVENANEAIVVAQDGILKFCNSKTAEITEFTQTELISKPFFELVHKDDCDLVFKRFQKRLKGEKVPDAYSFRLIAKSGELKWVNINSVVINWEGRAATLNFIADISANKIAEEELRKLTRAVEQSSSSIVITDTQGKIEYVNPYFCQLTGYSENETIGQNPRILKSDQTNPELFVEMWQTITDGREWRGEFVNRKKDGDLFWEFVSISPIKDEKGEITHFLGIKEDITEQKKLEDQLRQSQKMEAIGKLAGGVAHDFNNLLTVINGYAELLMGPLDRDDPVKKRLQQIRGAGKRAASLTNQLLAFSRKQMLKPEVLNINSLISDIEKMLKRLIGENIDLATFYELNLSSVKADAGQIEQIIINLAVNAKDAMLDGGNLTIETQNVYLDEDFAKQHKGATMGSYVMIAVSDTGSGIDKSIQSQIFDPFFTTKEKGKGTGLGLSTVYGIIKQSGGHIWVYSEKGKGTSFKIYLPTVKKKTTQIKDHAPQDGLYCGAETILLVEDEEDVRLLAEQALKELGYHLLIAGDGAQGLQTARSYEKKIDLLLADVIMPNMSGRELGEKIGKFHPDTKICYMSGYTDDAIVRHGVLEKGVYLLQKPFSLHTLAKKVREVLDDVHKIKSTRI